MTDMMGKYGDLLADFALFSFVATLISVIALVFFPEVVPSWFSWSSAFISGSLSLICGVGCVGVTVLAAALRRRVGVINDDSHPFVY